MLAAGEVCIFFLLKNGWHIIGHVTLWLGELLNGSFSTYFLHFLIVYTLKTIRANHKNQVLFVELQAVILKQLLENYDSSTYL